MQLYDTKTVFIPNRLFKVVSLLPFWIYQAYNTQIKDSVTTWTGVWISKTPMFSENWKAQFICNVHLFFTSEEGNSNLLSQIFESPSQERWWENICKQRPT